MPPVGLADKNDPSGAQALCQQLDSADDSPGDPSGPNTGCHTDLLVRDITGSIAMDERDLIGDAEFFSPEFRLFGEQLAHVDAGTDDAVIPCPGAQHLSRTAAKVKHACPRLQAQRSA